MDNLRKFFYEFGPFRLDVTERVLLRNGQPLPLTQKAFETLLVLVQHSGRLLDKNELLSAIWPDTFVEECTLFQNIFALRKVLGETAGKHRYIETVPRRGYRFIAIVSENASDSIEMGGNGATPRLKSLAVLPFDSLSSDKDDQYFGIGMADALITKLSNIRKIIVRPTSAVLRYDGHAQAGVTAGKELMADFVLEGRILKSDAKVRVTAQLINVETGAPLWADKFDEGFTDIFTLHDKISERLVDALTLQLTSDERKLLSKHHTRNAEAYQYYVRGRYQWNQWTEKGFLKSIECFRKVIELDSNYAMAYAGLADAYSALAYHDYVSPLEAMPQSKSAALHALHLDGTLAEASFSLASVLFLYDWDWLAAEREFCRAIEFNPGYATAYQGYGLFLMAMGRFDKAFDVFQHALELDPVSLLISTCSALPYYYSGRYDQALAQCQKTLDISDGFGLAHLVLGNVYVRKQMYDAAIIEYKRAMELLGSCPDVLSSLGVVYAVSGNEDDARRILDKLRKLERRYVFCALASVSAALGDKDNAFESLENGYEMRSNKLVYLNINPCFDGLRSDDRFADLLRRVSL